ncbi:MAG: hypothetical protein SWH61_14500 [Thermodesulfobacteriota bacterium]|nr:hypothetical protein [Thermodesulfobacteriota bacterium]
MPQIFEKKLFITEAIPGFILIAISVLFLSEVSASGNILIKMASLLIGLVFLFLSVKFFRYYFSFKKIGIINSSVNVYCNGKIKSFNIPSDIVQLRYGESDVQIHLDNRKEKFIVRSQILKNKEEFLKQLDALLAAHTKDDNGNHLPPPLKTLMQDQNRPVTISTRTAVIVILFVIGAFMVFFLYGYLLT